MKDVIIVLILIALTAAVASYLIRTKKRGAACIGCPHARQCGGKCGGSCSCRGSDDPR